LLPPGDIPWPPSVRLSVLFLHQSVQPCLISVRLTVVSHLRTSYCRQAYVVLDSSVGLAIVSFGCWSLPWLVVGPFLRWVGGPSLGLVVGSFLGLVVGSYLGWSSAPSFGWSLVPPLGWLLGQVGCFLGDFAGKAAFSPFLLDRLGIGPYGISNQVDSWHGRLHYPILILKSTPNSLGCRPVLDLVRIWPARYCNRNPCTELSKS
jgi:hypothetical protein